jgi:hypothetical protein
VWAARAWNVFNEGRPFSVVYPVLVLAAAVPAGLAPDGSILVALAGALALPGVAQGASSDVIRDCARDGKLDKTYSKEELGQARKRLPTDIDEYTNCREAIADQLNDNRGARAGASSTGGGGAGGGGGGGGSDRPSTPDDLAALEEATKRSGGGKAPELTVGDERITPGKGGLFSVANAANDIPLPLLLALISVALLMAATGVVAWRRHGLAGIRGSLPALKDRLPDLSSVGNLFRRR